MNMQNAYQAIIKGNTIKWIDQPQEGIDLHKGEKVLITFLDSLTKSQSNGAAMSEALRKLSTMRNSLSDIKDPVEWQREIRKDKTSNRFTK